MLVPTRRFALALAATLTLGGCLSNGGGGDPSATATSSSTGGGPSGSVGTPAPVNLPPPSGSPSPSPSPAGTPNIVRVGPSQTLKTLGAAAATAKDGDTIEVDGGNYRGDETVFLQRRLTIRGVSGRAVFDGAGGACGQKGILVLRGEDHTVENLELSNCSVPDANGAGIRHETGKLTVKNVVFRNNQEGVLTGNNSGLGPTDPRLSLEVYDSVFAGNGDGVGFAHNIYVGQIDSFISMGNYFTLGKKGHLLKTRAAKNYILYNRITDEGGQASYEVDMPNGGESYVIGNLIEQSALNSNNTIVAYGMEGLVWSKNELYLAHNTIINHTPANCTYVRAAAGSAARLVNNIWVGSCALALGGSAEQSGNVTVAESEFVNPAGFDYRLKSGSSFARSVGSPGSANGVSLAPLSEYRHTASRVAINPGTPLSPGAFQ